MKKIALNLFALAGLFTAFTSCSSDDDATKSGNTTQTPVVIQGEVTTRVTDSQWTAGDALGVTMYNNDLSAVENNQFNRRYITSASALGTFTAATADQTIYFPQNDSAIQLKAYYPYYANLNANMQIQWNVTDQSSLPAIDLMTSEHLTGFRKTDSDVKLHFYHRLSKLIFVLSLEDENDNVDLSDCTLTMSGMVSGNTYDLFNDVMLDLPQDTLDITVPLRTGETENRRQAIVLPREAGEGIVFTFVNAEGGTYVAHMSSVLELEPGNQYTFYVRLSKNPVTITADIEPWIDNDPEYITAQ